MAKGAGRHVVKVAKVSKKLLGGWQVEFACPGCQKPLTSGPDDIGRPDDCPHCETAFMLSAQLRKPIAEEEEAAERKREAAQQRSADAAQDRERKRAAREVSREQATGKDQRGYDYPILRLYETVLSAVGLGGALLCALAIAGWVLLYFLGRGRVPLEGTLLASGVLVLVGVLWWLCWKLVAEMVRLAVTVALDVRELRDNTRSLRSGDNSADEA